MERRLTLGEKKQELKAKEIVLPLDWSKAVTSSNSNRRHPEIPWTARKQLQFINANGLFSAGKKRSMCEREDRSDVHFTFEKRTLSTHLLQLLVACTTSITR